MRDRGLDEAIRAAGGVTELARRIGVAQPSVSNWDRVPADRVVAVENVTGVPRVRLRPDLFNEDGVGGVDEIDSERAHYYELLATFSLSVWENDPALSRVPFIAVSLTRHPGEAHLLDINHIAGFLYLPTLDREDALSLLNAVQRRRRPIIPPPTALQWPGTTPVAHHR